MPDHQPYDFMRLPVRPRTHPPFEVRAGRALGRPGPNAGTGPSAPDTAPPVA
jgi:hypothetical protein